MSPGRKMKSVLLGWAHLVTATKLQRAPSRNAAFMRQIWARRRLLPDESGVPVAVARCTLLGLLLGFLTNPGSIWACAACYGQSDSPMAHGLNWGIFSLLLVVVLMLGGIASFFVYLARRSSALSSGANQSPIIHH